MTMGICILLPVAAGLILLLIPEIKNQGKLCVYMACAMAVAAAFSTALLLAGKNGAWSCFYLTETLQILFAQDGPGRFFAAVTTVVWLAAGIYSIGYMKHEENIQRYDGFYLIVYGILMGLNFSGNLVTFYAFYEMLTLLSMPLVLHSGSKEAIIAALKYLFFSFAGAYLVLFGTYILYRYGTTLAFTAGGVLTADAAAGHGRELLAGAFAMLLGFGVKAGLFPMHTWLPSAHPVAPAPASGILSGIIAKSGVLGAVRVVFYLFGADFLRGTWVQEVWLGLILFTVLMGSVLAYREKVLKKRLAYSTVSQVSYALLGLAMMDKESFTGSFLHVVAHAVMKCGLFLCAGAVITMTGKTRVDELRGIGKKMPVTFVCFTLLSLSLIGIPPFAGFVSKWYLGVGSISSGLPVFDILAPAVLLLSALFTAGYLLPISINAFFPGAGYAGEKKKEAPGVMLIPIMVLTLLAAAGGMFPQKLMAFLYGIAGMLM